MSETFWWWLFKPSRQIFSFWEKETICPVKTIWRWLLKSSQKNLFKLKLNIFFQVQIQTHLLSNNQERPFEDDCSNPCQISNIKILATKSPFKLKYTFSFKFKFFRHTCSQISRTFVVDDCSNPNITKKLIKTKNT